jgi:hypothetical protein
VVPKLAFGLVALGAVGIATAAGSGFDFRFAPEIREIAKLAPQNNSDLRDLCFMEKPGAKFSLHRAGRQAAAVLVGRFHRGRASSRLEEG